MQRVNIAADGAFYNVPLGMNVKLILIGLFWGAIYVAYFFFVMYVVKKKAKSMQNDNYQKSGYTVKQISIVSVPACF